MTGFARAAGRDEALAWWWEVKSVNGRGLDVRCRLPAGFAALEAAARAAVAARFARGNVTLSLQIESSGGARLAVNRRALDQLAGLVRALGGEPRLDTLLTVRGVVEPAEETPSEAIRSEREARLLAGLEESLDALAAARREEGRRLARVLDDQLSQIADLARAAAEAAAAQPRAIRERLHDKVAALLAAAPALSEDRLAQEVALLLAKADVSEEIDRLAAHIAAARELLAGDGPIGRRLDFLTQELNREANTLCAKAAELDLTRVGLELKAVIEQFREQVQNIE